METFWVDAEMIGLTMPDNMAVNNAVKAMGDQAELIDAVLDEQ